MPQLFAPQQQVAGYEILELVGKGGMGEVYRARQLSMDRVVALKILAPKLAKKDPTFAHRFVDEARAAGRLNHPNIIAVHDVGDTTVPGEGGAPETIHYFSMEFVDGESVKDIVDRDGALPPPLLGQIMAAMAEALAYAENQGIVHRDIKPDNIMVASGGLVKLADLGLAQRVGDDAIVAGEDAKARKVMGTPAYMSPEQARALPTGPQSDQYSLGATLFHMLTGRPPYTGPDAKSLMKSHVFDPVPDPKAVVEAVPEPWRQLCLRLMAKEPGARFANAGELRTAVKQAIAGDAGAPAVSRRHRSARALGAGAGGGERRSGGMGLLIGAGALLAATALVLVFARGGGSGGDGVAPPSPPPTTPGTAAADPAVDRARALVAGLPRDAKAAIGALDAALADAALTAPAREVLTGARAERERQLRDAAQAAQQAFQARLAAIDDHIAGDRFAQAGAALDALPAATGPDLAAVRERRARLEVEIASLATQLATRVEGARDETALQRTLAEAAAAPFTPAQRQEIETAAAARRVALEREAELAARRSEIGPRWTALAAALEPLRYSARYDEMRQAIAAAVDGFPTPESQEQARALLAVPELAQRAELLLRAHVRAKQPPAVARFTGELRKVVVVGLDDRQVQVRQQQTAAVRLERAAVPLDYRTLLTQALDLQPAAERKDRDRLLAAFLSVWSPPEALALCRTSQDPLAQALIVLEGRRTAPSLLARPLRPDEGRVGYAYDFTSGDGLWLGDFTGQGLQHGPRGLLWRCDAVVPATDRSEAVLPTMRWKGRLRPPFTLDARVRLNAETNAVMIGVESGGAFQRLVFILRNLPKIGLAPMGTDNGGRYLLGSKFGNDPVWPLDQPVRVLVTVDQYRRVTLAANDKVSETATALPEGPLSAVVQIFQAAPGGSVEIESLFVEGVPEP